MTLRYTRITSWDESASELTAIRERVFVQEQRIDPALEWDEEDEDATHFLVKDETERSLATARLIADNETEARIGRFAVLPEHRKSGLATGLLRFVIGYARSQQFRKLTLSAQTHIQHLYAQQGFQVEGEEYPEAGIPHVKMTLQLNSRSPSAEGIVGEDATVYRFHSATESTHYLSQICRQARQEILILSKDLEKGILDEGSVLEAMSQFARKGRSSQISVCIADDQSPVKQSNQLLSLARKLTSSIAIKLIPAEYAFPDQVYVLVDKTGVVLRHHHERWEGFCNYNDPGLARRLSEQFHHLWSLSRQSQELRQFTL